MDPLLRPLRFFVDPSWRRRDGSHIPLLYPFWGNAFSRGTPLIRAIFDTYSFDTSLYSITDSIHDADAILLPYAYGVVVQKFPEILAQAVQVSKEHKAKLIIDTLGDIDYQIEIPQIIVLRYGGYRFLKKDNDIIIPPYADDLLERFYGGKLQLREKRAIPIVGFMGWAALSKWQIARTLVRELPDRVFGLYDNRYWAFKKGIFFRKQALRVLNKSKLIEKHFVTRPTYSVHTRTASDDPAVLRTQFVEHALASDLGLDVRGDANASTRLFELLSLGRVPLIVDTERNFPFSNELDYSAFSIKVDFRDLNNIAEIARARYDALSETEWRKMQEKARDAYREWFRVDALTKHLMASIRERLK